MMYKDIFLGIFSLCVYRIVASDNWGMFGILYEFLVSHPKQILMCSCSSTQFGYANFSNIYMRSMIRENDPSAQNKGT